MNRYNGLLDPIEKKYEGKIIEILNDARIKLSECDDMYMKEKANKYKLPIIDEAMKAIGEIQNNYVNQANDILEAERAKLNSKPADNKTNTEKLLAAINLQNRIKLNEYKYGNMNIQELLAAGAETESEIDLQQIKYIAANKVNAAQMDGTEKQALLTNIRTMTGNTPEMQFKAFESEIKSLDANKQSLLPGVGMADRLIISGKGGPKGWLLQDIEYQEEDTK